MEKADTMDAMLARLAKRCTLATIIDVGASTGCWSEVAARHWPAANLILIEADERHFDALADFQARHVCHIAHMMAGDHCGTGYFAASPTDPFGGQGSTVARPDTVEKRCTTVDLQVMGTGFPGPYLLKLDTHGYERQIMAGAQWVLARAAALVIEAYTCTLQPGAWRFWELCQYLVGYGFVPTDVVDVMRRPLDDRWWQADMAFERASAPHVGEGRYR